MNEVSKTLHLNGAKNDFVNILDILNKIKLRKYTQMEILIVAQT